MTVAEKIEKLRALMRKNNISIYIIPTNDYHGSEYVGDFFKDREYMSGFTGSAGTLVVTETEALLWTDGRYFIQAEEQLKNTHVKLMKMFEKDVPDLYSYIASFPANTAVGLNGKTVSQRFVSALLNKCKNIKLSSDIDLVSEIWQDRPDLPHEPIWILDEQYAGVPAKVKLVMVRKSMEKLGADYFVVSALDEIAWLTNLRGNDVQCTPVFLSYMLISAGNALIYIQQKSLIDRVKNKLNSDGFTVKDYGELYADIKNLSAGTVLFDDASANHAIVECIPENLNKLSRKSPVMLFKSRKNKIEQVNMINAHIKDGVALTKFIYWLKTNIGKTPITEISAAEKLEELRKMGQGYIEPSFDPIMAYASHGAIVHYEATDETNAELQPNGLFLTDTGGHYFEGTTDVTRTIALGKLTDREREIYTAVLRGNLNLSGAVFPCGTTGENLDYLARSPLWEKGLDFNHGTGHGVGYLLSVHEGPQRFYWKINQGAPVYPIEEGMVISNEPGYYEENVFGVRLENLMMVVPVSDRFYRFENLTMAPFDLDAVDAKLLSDREREILNNYHKKVYEKISPYLSENEKEWLKTATEKI